jgi:hypothetical protein
LANIPLVIINRRDRDYVEGIKLMVEECCYKLMRNGNVIADLHGFRGVLRAWERFTVDRLQMRGGVLDDYEIGRGYDLVYQGFKVANCSVNPPASVMGAGRESVFVNVAGVILPDGTLI